MSPYGGRDYAGWSVQFSRIISPIEDMQIWNANSGGFSFVISYESRTGPGLHGRPGFVASWRPLNRGWSAVKVIGSPFTTFTAAEQACETVLGYLTEARQGPGFQPGRKLS